jgi:hypothetical protein
MNECAHRSVNKGKMHLISLNAIVYELWFNNRERDSPNTIYSQNNLSDFKRYKYFNKEPKFIESQKVTSTASNPILHVA